MSMNNLTTPTVTGFSSFWGASANQYAMLRRTAGTNTSMPGYNIARGVAQVLGRTGLKGLNKKMRQLVGNGVSGNASATNKRIQQSGSALNDSNILGGVRAIETVSAFPGDADGTVAVTAADRDAIYDIIDKFLNAPISSYPTDASGNGGGGKLGR